MNYMKWMPEPRFKMALCSLYSGNAQEAVSWLERPLHFILNMYNAQDPDPVEWAYFIIAALCMGNMGEAVARSDNFPGSITLSWIAHDGPRAFCAANQPRPFTRLPSRGGAARCIPCLSGIFKSGPNRFA